MNENMQASNKMHLGLQGRSSPMAQSPTAPKVDGALRHPASGNRFGPPPGLNSLNSLNAQLDLSVERDAYGQPLSPTHLITNNKTFGQLHKGDGPKRLGGESEASQALGQTSSNQGQRQFTGSEEQKTDAQNQNQSGVNQTKAAEAAKKQPEEQLQQGLKGGPKMTGLSSYEYAVDGSVGYYCAEPKADLLDEPTIQRYQKIFHRSSKTEESKVDKNTSGGTSAGITRKNIQIETDKSIFSLDNEFVPISKKQRPEDDKKVERENNRCMMELAVNLPMQTLVEQIELKFTQNAQKYELFKKYLRIAGTTRTSLLRKEATERDTQIGQDVQMTVLGPVAAKAAGARAVKAPKTEKDRRRAQKFFRLQSGYFDEQKKIAEMNMCGAVCDQLNILFEFDREKAHDLIQKCKEIQSKQIGPQVDKSNGNIKQTNRGELVYQTEPRNNGDGASNKNAGVADEKLMYQVSNTQSQFMSSYGGEIYDAEGSEMDYLDNEVSNIARKRQQQKKMQNLEQSNSSTSDIKKVDIVRPDDIKIIIDDERNQEDLESSQNQEQLNAYFSKTASGGNFKPKLQNEAMKLSNTAGQGAGQNQPYPEYTPEEKKLFEEKKIFDGQNESQWATRLLQQVLVSIKVIGFNVNKIPAITNLSHLMNTSFYLRKDQVHLEDALEVDFLLGALFVSSKRNTQAIELLRNRVQAPYLLQIEANVAKLQGKDDQAQNRGVTGEAGSVKTQEQNPILSYDDRANLKVQIKKLYTRAAIIELICSESMCIRPQLNDKLQSLVRMTQLCRGHSVRQMPFGSQIFLADDEYTTMVKILPFMLKFTIQCIEYNSSNCNREAIVVSALRNIQFILETQGCSLDSAMIVILKSILKNYPDRVKQEKMLKKSREFKERMLKGSREHEVASGPGEPGKTLLSEARRIGGIHGTCSANELNLRQQSNNGLNSTKEIHQIMNYQFNQNSARGSGVTDQIKIDEPRNHQADQYRMDRFEKMTMIESIFSLGWMPFRDEPTVRKEPNSGFEKTLQNLFNSLLDTYISVLSSISSHILHQIFYEVIVPCLTNQPFEEDKAYYEAMDKEEQQIYTELSSEVRIFAVKIAEKIITICQGDLIMNRSLLDTLVKSQSSQSFKKQLEMSGASEQLRGQMKNLWASIRSKVFTNYSMKGFKQLIEWLVSKMSLLAQNCTIRDEKSSASEIAMLELPGDDLQQLSQYLEIITFISVGRRNNQEEANSLIKIKQDYCMDLYLLLNPLLFWLDFSVEREERLALFKQVYQTIKDVLENLPPKKVDIDILQIIIPILQRTSEYLRQNSPSQSMLKFLDIVLQDIKTGKYCQTNYPDLQYFFLDQLNSIVNYISYCLYEEIFPVFDKLLSLSQDVMTEKVLRKCIMALIDKYTMKNKAHKTSIQAFMKSLMEVSINQQKKNGLSSNRKDASYGHELMDIFDQEIDIVDNSELQASHRRKDQSGANNKGSSPKKNQMNQQNQGKSNFFDVMLDYCFFENDDQPARVAAELLKCQSVPPNLDDSMIRADASLQFRSPHDLHELFIDKLQFFIDSLNLMGERHINQFSALLFNPKFKSTLFSLLNRGEANLRLKCHEILEIIGTYYMQYCSSKTLYELTLPNGAGAGGGRGGRARDLLRDSNMMSEQTRAGEEFEMIEVEFINHERLYIAQMMVQCVRKSFELNNGSDAYLQFNSLILLDYLFQNMLPVPTFQNEQLKARQNVENQIQQQRRLLDQRERIRDTNNLLNESQIEDGSSGGEGTTGRAAAAAAAARQGSLRTRDDTNANGEASAIIRQRQLNANYLGDIEEGMDLETLELRESTPELEVTDSRYTAMRLKLVYKLWPYVQEALNSPWSNIRSICYGLICSMLKVDVRDCNKYLPYQSAQGGELGQDIEVTLNRNGREPSRERASATQEQEVTKEFEEKDKELLESNKFHVKLRQFVIPMMINLLSSKESESKAGGLNILGSICGLSYDFSKVKISRHSEFFKRNSEFISLPIWQLVFELQDDWDITIKEASIVLIQLCAPREAIKYFNKCKIDKENQKFQQMLNKMAKNGGGQGGHGSMSNLSSARQNSLYNHINSKGSLNGLKKCLNENGGGDLSQRRIDYKQVDFGYKNKAIPNIAELKNEFGKIDIARFLNGDQDMMNINIDEENGASSEATDLQQNFNQLEQKGLLPKSARIFDQHETRQDQSQDRAGKKADQKTPGQNLVGNKQLALDLDKVNQAKDESKKRNINGAFDVEAAFQQSSLSQRSNLFGNSNQLQINQKILIESQQQNQNLAQAMQGSFPNTTQSSPMNVYQQFDFFVDEYSDEQIQEIISIFRNDFKPPKNLWIEKAAESSIFNGPDFYADIYSQAIEQFNQQQMILQQKQQQELQDQVSSVSSSPRGSPGPAGIKLGPDGQHMAAGGGALAGSPRSVAGEFSPPAQVERSGGSQAQQDNSQVSKNQNTSQNIQQNANAAQQQILQNLKQDSEQQQSNKQQDSQSDGTENNMQIFERHVQTNDQEKGSAVGKQGSASSSADQDDHLKNNQSGPKNEAVPPSPSDPTQATSNQLLPPPSQQIPPGPAPSNSGEKQFDPATDLNIFEQINFDEMNINLEDINQANQKQDVINSSNSDCGDPLVEDMPENAVAGNENSLEDDDQYPSMQMAAGEGRDLHDQQFWQAKASSTSSRDSTNQNDKLKQALMQKKAGENEGHHRQLGEMTHNRGDIEAAHQLSNEMLDASNELVKEMEDMDFHHYSSEDTQKQFQVQQAHIEEKQQKFNNIGTLGTQLQIIESMSNEVSSVASVASNSQQTHTGEMGEIGEVGGSRGSYTGSGSANNRSRDDHKESKNFKDIQESGFDEGMPVQHRHLNLGQVGQRTHHDAILDDFEQKNNKTLQMIQQEKRHQQQLNSNLADKFNRDDSRDPQPGVLNSKPKPQRAHKLDQQHPFAQTMQQQQNLKLMMLSSSGNTVSAIPANSSSGGGPPTLQGQQIQQHEPSSAATSSAAGGGIAPAINVEHVSSAYPQKTFSKTQVIDMRIIDQLDGHADQQMPAQRHQQRVLPTKDPSNGNIDTDNDRKLKKPVSNSNSTPDFKSQLQQIAAKNAQQKQRLKDNKNIRTGVAQKNASEIESARLNFVTANIPLAPHAHPSNFGNFSHRVQGGGTGAGVANPSLNFNSNSSVNNTKKQILKNLKQIKTNNEDYFIMQNISSQMGGQVTGPLSNMNLKTNGLNTTKNKKADKSLENLVLAFQKGLQTKSGHGTSLGRGNQDIHNGDGSQKQYQSQDLSSMGTAVQPKPQTRGGNAKNQQRHPTHRSGQTKSAGKKKTMSTSPHRQSNQNEIAKLLMGGTSIGGQVTAPGRKQKQSNQQSNHGSNSGGAQRASKSHRNAGTAVSGPSSQHSTQIQYLASNQQNNSKKIKENMRDLNYFIKTIEKFSKKTNIQTDNNLYQTVLLQQQTPNQPNMPQVSGTTQGVAGTSSQGGPGGPGGYQNIMTLSSAGTVGGGAGTGTGSDPQTPKDVLINLGDQLMKYHTNSAQGKINKTNNTSGNSNTRKNGKSSKANKSTTNGMAGIGSSSSGLNKAQGGGQKSKSAAYGGGTAGRVPSTSAAQQLYEQIKNQQQQQMSTAAVENIQNQLKKNGFNLTQLNKILSKGIASEGEAHGNGRMNRGSSTSGGHAYTGGQNQKLLSQQHGHTQPIGSGESRSKSGRGIFDLTPDSNSNGGQQRGPKQVPLKPGVASKSSKSNHSQYGTSYSPQNRISQKSQNSHNYAHPLGNLNIKTNMEGMIGPHKEGSSIDSNSRGRKPGRSTSGNHGNARKINFANDQTSGSRGTTSAGRENVQAKNKNKKLSFNLNQPPQLNNLMLMNYSQTQKFDLREINQQLMAATNPHHQKGAGSTQHKAQNNGMISFKNSSKIQTLNSQREKRERSAGSANSTTGGVGAGVQQRLAPGPPAGGQFDLKNQNQTSGSGTAPQKYNNLLLSNKYAKSPGQNNTRGGSYNTQKRGLSSPKNADQQLQLAGRNQSAGRGTSKQNMMQKSLQAPGKAPGSARAGARDLQSGLIGTNLNKAHQTQAAGKSGQPHDENKSNKMPNKANLINQLKEVASLQNRGQHATAAGGPMSHGALPLKTGSQYNHNAAVNKNAFSNGSTGASKTPSKPQQANQAGHSRANQEFMQRH